MEVHNMHAWIQANREDFKPPVCNKCLFKGQLWSFFIGGPNQRRDFHLEEGEEFFFQVQGDMILRVLERGAFRDVTIREGEAFLLPAHIPHSPQRFAGTVGFVIERRREAGEKDGLRYYVGETEEILYERWTHVADIVADLPPIIRGYFASKAHETGRPTEESILGPPAFAIDRETELMRPQPLRSLLQSLSEDAKLAWGVKSVLDVFVGKGERRIETSEGDVFVWQVSGEGTLVVDGKSMALDKDSLCCLPHNSNAICHSEDDAARLLLIRMPV